MFGGPNSSVSSFANNRISSSKFKEPSRSVGSDGMPGITSCLAVSVWSVSRLSQTRQAASMLETKARLRTALTAWSTRKEMTSTLYLSTSTVGFWRPHCSSSSSAGWLVGFCSFENLGAKWWASAARWPPSFVPCELKIDGLVFFLLIDWLIDLFWWVSSVTYSTILVLLHNTQQFKPKISPKNEAT